VTETERLVAVRRYKILDTPPDGAFDRITAIATRLLKVPIALISIVDDDRIWFKSRQGIEAEQVARDLGLCASCILQDAPWIVTNAKRDIRALANPLVAGQAGIQFYLGIPLHTHDGFNLGTLCVLDRAPRAPSQEEVAHLTDLAAMVVDQLELRVAALKAVADYQDELGRRERREEEIKGLMRELAHRSKNLLAVVQAISRETAPDDFTSMQYASFLTARIQALALTHDLIGEENWHGARLHELVVRQVGRAEQEKSRLQLAGPDIVVTPTAAQHIGLALHELASNARRYGALSANGGGVSFSWELEERPPTQRWLRMTWREHDGPAVKAPERRGFGRLVLERATPDGLGGSAELLFSQTGVVWSCEAPHREAGRRHA
jgi:two-component sensor histidine kinase